MMDDRGRAFEEGRRDFAGGDDRVHFRDQEAGVAGVASLRGGIEDQRKAQPERAQNQADQHLDIAPGVPDAQTLALSAA